MRHIARALSLFSRERGLWRYAWRPLAWAALSYLAVFVAVVAFAASFGNRWAGPWGELGGALLAVVIVVGCGGAIFLALVAFFSGFGFDALSAEVERRTTGTVVGTSPTFAEGLADGVGRGLLAGFLGLIALCTGFTLVVPYLIASALSLMDFTAPALVRRNVKMGRQFGVASRLPGSVSFALVAGAITLVPFLNVLSLPILLVAGTLMVIEGDRRG